MTPIVLALAAFLISALLTWVVRNYAVTKGVLDVPNARSSHKVTTPRGGGLAIVLTYLAGVSALFVLGWLPSRTTGALLAAGSVTAVVGFWDDHASLSARLRFTAHFVAAAIALAALGGMPSLSIMDVATLSGWLAQTFALLMVVWFLNLYNFMDGIDGIAALEAVTVALGGAAAAFISGYPAGVSACLLLAAASAGFLVWNFPPAKIFMGDVGSGFLGVVFGVLAIDAAIHSPVLFWSWLILLGGFIVDATVTLLRRLVRGDPVYLAHRSHAYQRAARAIGRHRPVAIAFGAANVLWLLPFALLAATGRFPGEIALVIAWLPLIFLALWWRAGFAEEREA